MGDRGAESNALCNIGGALLGTNDRTGYEPLESALALALEHRLEDHAARAYRTLLFYAASVLIGTLPDTITTILALLAGVGLFVFGFYALTHQERMKQLTAMIQQRWTVWHSWR